MLPDHDRLTDRDRALLKALKRLSRPQRRALVLHDGLGLPADAVAVEVESTVAAAEGRVWAARTALAHWVPELVGPDPAADGFADRLCGLLHRAAVRGVPEPHRPPVPLLRARHGLVAAGRTGAAALLTVAVGGAVAATLAGAAPGRCSGPPIRRRRCSARRSRRSRRSPRPCCRCSRTGRRRGSTASGAHPRRAWSRWCWTRRRPGRTIRTGRRQGGGRPRRCLRRARWPSGRTGIRARTGRCTGARPTADLARRGADGTPEGAGTAPRARPGTASAPARITGRGRSTRAGSVSP